MLHGIKLRKSVYILTHHKIKSMTLLLKLFLFHILYACGNKITPFSSVCVSSQNFKICNLNCTVFWLWVSYAPVKIIHASGDMYLSGYRWGSVSTVIRILILSRTHISGWLHIKLKNIYAMLSISAAQNSVFNEEVAYFWTFKNDQISVIVDIHIAYSTSNIFSNHGDIAKIHVVMIISKLYRICFMLQAYIL